MKILTRDTLAQISSGNNSRPPSAFSEAKTQSPTAIQPAVSPQSIPEPPAKRDIQPEAAQESEHAPAAPKPPQPELDQHKVANVTAQLSQAKQPEPAPPIAPVAGAAAGFAADLANNPRRSELPRQGNGTDLLGVNDPRAASIGIIYVAPANDWTRCAACYPDAGETRL